MLHYEENGMHASFPFIMKESTNTSALQNIALHHEGRLAHGSFPYNTRTSALPKTILHREGNLTHSFFPYIMKESTRTSQLSMHHEGNLTHASFPSIVKESTSALEKTTTLHHKC